MTVETCRKFPLLRLSTFKCGICGHTVTRHLLPVFKAGIDVSTSGRIRVEVPVQFEVSFICERCKNLTHMKLQDDKLIAAYLEWYESTIGRGSKALHVE